MSAKFENACEITWIYESALNCIPLLLSYFFNFYCTDATHIKENKHERGTKLLKNSHYQEMAAPKHFTAFKSKLTNKTEHVQQNIV